MSLGARTRLPLAVFLLSLVATAGCMHVEFTKPTWPTWFESKPEGPPKGQVVMVSPMWKDGVIVMADPGRNGALTPGFAGIVHLMDTEDQTVEPDGVINIQLYDDLQTPTTPPTPREMWTLNAEVLKSVMKKDAIGWGYHFWLPWGMYSPQVNKVTLVILYKDKSGREVWSKPTCITVADERGLRKPSELEVQPTLTKTVKKDW
jgi:hypothetical protein